MDLGGAVTLLELTRVPHGTRLAFCLPSGEFILATGACAVDLGVPSAAATELHGKSLYQFLELCDTEKLQDYTRARFANGVYVGGESANSPLRMLVHVAGSPARSQTVWVRLVTLPLTMRLLRCIDALHFFGPTHSFADSSSFVLTDDELSSLFSQQALSTAAAANAVALADSDGFMTLESPTMVPLELKDPLPPPSCADTDDVTDLSDASDRSSLSNYAFEADWMDEIDEAFLLPAQQPVASSSSPSPATWRLHSNLAT